MQRVKLANVLLESNDRFQDYPSLYCRTSKSVPFDESKGAFTLFPYEKFDFATFFNVFSNKKWRRYTVVDNVHVHLELCGDCEVSFIEIRETLAKPKRIRLGAERIASQEFKTIEFEFNNENAELLSFEIVTYGLCLFRNGYYYSQVNEADVRPVELALATTTFRQEQFIIPNIELIKSRILESDEVMNAHFHLHVVDNGRTLDAEGLSGPSVTVHPNKNVGGAGGFTRGIIEALRQQGTEATHVLLMDDDVQVSPESLIRTFNVLSLVNEEYQDAFISGAMISYERQNEFYEDVGWVRSDGLYGPVKPRLDIEDLEDVVKNDSLEIRKPNRYAGWWYCCIPTNVIKREGLPLPIFIRGDDAEYGNRAANRFITMNGICVWHLTLALKFRAHLERYQVPRNSLIAQSTTGVFSGVDFMEQFRHNVQLDFKTLNYDAVEQSLDALEDYLKGPRFIMEDRGEEILKKQAKLNEQLVDLAEIDDPRLDFAVIDPTALFNVTERTFFERLVDYLTYSGHRLPDFLLKDDLAIIPWDGWFYPAKKTRLRKNVLAVSLDGRQGVLRTMDKKRFRRLHKRYAKLMKQYRSQAESVAAEYRAARDEMTSLPFWMKYLEID
ncbi:hypothetical protein B5F40_15060 [Gordonibacter sp. An230]|uniref:glycosyltransferase n=1 Tax=Gordonibacter sp. An230 TaxID=1965592 RepID=UPI000B3ACCD2|nr:glycosyltransferase [Gordonibacter sp. An230]OUO86467.1 hypothetical protein B5F40_15060 [Gordonibacter sp. An230]